MTRRSGEFDLGKWAGGRRGKEGGEERGGTCSDTTKKCCLLLLSIRRTPCRVVVTAICAAASLFSVEIFGASGGVRGLVGRIQKVSGEGQRTDVLEKRSVEWSSAAGQR